MFLLKEKGILLNRKVLALLAQDYPHIFKTIMDFLKLPQDNLTQPVDSEVKVEIS
jgi:ribosomal protein L20